MTKNVTPQNWQLEFATWTDAEVNELTGLIDRAFVEVQTKFAHQIKDIPQIDLASIKKNPVTYAVFKEKQAEHIYYFKKFPKYVQEKAKEHIDEATEKVEFDAQKLAKSLSMIEGISTRHASFIAKDQLAKFSANIHEAQAAAAGAKRYIWRTSNDNRVRPEHQKREGKIYSYSVAPSDGNPGTPYGCRCYAEAIVKL